jgi:protein-disulfide isomerase
MPSGKRAKQQRRAAVPPPAQSKGAPRARQASPRVLAIAGGAVALVALVVVLVIVFTGGSDSKVPNGIPTVGSPTSEVALPGAQEVDTLYKGVAQKKLSLGSAFAPATMVEYIDLQCPFCQQFETEVMPDIIKDYVKTGKLKVETRVLAFIGPDSEGGRDAMVAAGLQNKAYQFASILYANQGTENTGWLDDNMIATAAASIAGMNVPKLMSDRNTSSVKDEAKSFDGMATADKVSSTPTLFVGKSGTKGKQVPLTSATDKQSLVDAIETALAG